MSNPYRIYTFVHRIFKTESKKMINLTKVSSVELKGKTVIFNLSHEKHGIFGNFIFMTGGDTKQERLFYNTKEEAQTEFDNINTQLTNYYAK
jgi:hypothetical protein